MAAPAIRVEDLCCRIGGREILSSVNFTIAQGEFVSLVGPNGAGKSTLLRCLDRIRAVAGGRIEIAARRLEQYAQRDLARVLGYVPQADGRYLPFTVHEFVLMGRYPHLSPFSNVRPEDRQAVAAALHRTGTAELAGRMMGTLSGGERQKIFIAAAIAQETQTLLLDEPTTFLDPRHQAEILHILHAVQQEHGVTVLAVTHDLNAAALVSDRVLALKAGRLAFDGPPDRLMTNAVLRQVYDKDFLLVPHPQTGRLMMLPEAVA